MTKAVGTAGGTATGYVFFCCTAHGSCYALVYVCCDSDLVVLYEHIEKIRRLSEGSGEGKTAIRRLRSSIDPRGAHTLKKRTAIQVPCVPPDITYSG